MKTITILKNLISIYYYLLIGGCILFAVISCLDFLFHGNISVLKILQLPISVSEIQFEIKIVFILVMLLILFLFTRAVFLVKQIMPDLSSGNIFSIKVVKNFKKSGKLFLILASIELIYRIGLSFFIDNKFKVIDSSIIMFLVVGLFFMFLSEVFEKARRLQQENDLTI